MGVEVRVVEGLVEVRVEGCVVVVRVVGCVVVCERVVIRVPVVPDSVLRELTEVRDAEADPAIRRLDSTPALCWV